MTTYTLTVDGTDIINDAARLAGGLGIHETMEGESVTVALRFLNDMVKEWQTDGYHMWTRKEVTVFLDGSQSYLLGPDGDHWAETWYYTTLDGDVSSAATSFDVASASDITVGDNIGIKLSDGTRMWTTVKNKSSSTITLPAGSSFTGAASDGATVFNYTTKPQRPLNIYHARRAPYNGSDIPVELESLNEYFDTPNKSQTGTITQVAFKPTLTNSTLYVWQPDSSVDNVLKLTVDEPLPIFASVGDAPHFPDEWMSCLKYNLAERLEPIYRILPIDRRQEIQAQAGLLRDKLLLFDSDLGSMRFTR